MTDKELIRRALMGDQEAQKQCTEKGIALPCPFCGGDVVLRHLSREAPFSETLDTFCVTCQRCGCNPFSFSGQNLFYTAKGINETKILKQKLLGKWNTRPAPPVGRCGECKYFNHFFNAVGHCMIHSQEKDSFGDRYRVEMLKTDFCSYFEPREE